MIEKGITIEELDRGKGVEIGFLGKRRVRLLILRREMSPEHFIVTALRRPPCFGYPALIPSQEA